MFMKISANTATAKYINAIDCKYFFPINYFIHWSDDIKQNGWWDLVISRGTSFYNM